MKNQQNIVLESYCLANSNLNHRQLKTNRFFYDDFNSPQLQLGMPPGKKPRAIDSEKEIEYGIQEECPEECLN
ncbi:hypothetical protein [Pollutibacter soli]|uniref:hypothetical protein n=1 Tax=Pollutibacter soli TaxID=3034157 RepID=UPI00301321E2